MRLSLTVFLIFCLAACGSEPVDETKDWSAQRFYEEAKDYMVDHNYEKAIQMLEKLESRYPYGRYAQQAQLEIAYANYKNNEPVAAIAACERFIKLHPNHPNVDYAYYLKGLVNFNEDLGLMGALSGEDLTERDPKAAQDSFDTFKELVTRFPQSRYAEDASLRLRYLVNSLALHEVHVARYYMKRGAYVAAANRAQHAIKTYPQAVAVEEALHIMAQAYHMMGMPDLRDDAWRVLARNFPGSKYLTGEEGRQQAWWKFWQ
ncbi:MAG: outer membrane protein assembly factor BamD [Pseudomonadota bacterium]